MSPDKRLTDELNSAIERLVEGDAIERVCAASDSELAPYLTVFSVLRDAASHEARPEFRSALRARLLREASGAYPASPSMSVLRRAAAVAAATALLGAAINPHLAAALVHRVEEMLGPSVAQVLTEAWAVVENAPANATDEQTAIALSETPGGQPGGTAALDTTPSQRDAGTAMDADLAQGDGDTPAQLSTNLEAGPPAGSPRPAPAATGISEPLGAGDGRTPTVLPEDALRQDTPRPAQGAAAVEAIRPTNRDEAGMAGGTAPTMTRAAPSQPYATGTSQADAGTTIAQQPERASHVDLRTTHPQVTAASASAVKAAPHVSTSQGQQPQPHVADDNDPGPGNEPGTRASRSEGPHRSETAAPAAGFGAATVPSSMRPGVAAHAGDPRGDDEARTARAGESAQERGADDQHLGNAGSEHPDTVPGGGAAPEAGRRAH
jgi:hypothetical protein